MAYLCWQKAKHMSLSERDQNCIWYSFTGNALGCAAANASLDLFEQKDTQTKIGRIVDLQAEAATHFLGHSRV